MSDEAQTVADRIGIVIPVRNRPHDLALCLDAVLESGAPPHSVIVVDDASPDETTLAVAAERGVQTVRRSVRGGPAAARNTGIAAARSFEIVAFVDADVVVPPDTLERLRAAFRSPSVGAVFGSYDARPAAPTIVSRYRNLVHHFVHQNAAIEAWTFWAGCGAIRMTALLEVGGFDEDPHWHFIEDIEIGNRLKAAGWRLRLDKGLQAKHLKAWTLASMARTDTAYRARPWSHLLLDMAVLPDDLNVSRAQRTSVIFSTAACGLLLAAPFAPVTIVPGLLLLLAVAALNWRLLKFLRRSGGSGFAVAGFFLHIIHYLCAALGFVWAWVERQSGRGRPRTRGYRHAPLNESGPSASA